MATPKRTAQTQMDSRLAQILAVLEARTKLLAFFFGLCFVTALLVLAICFPDPTAFQYTVFRIVLALAAAGVAGVIPGMIRLKVQPGTALLIHAGGALAVFVMVYLLAPAALTKEQPAPPPPSPSPPENEDVGVISNSTQPSDTSVFLSAEQDFSFSIEAIRIMHEAGVKVAFPGDRTAQILPADAVPSDLLNMEMIDLSNLSLRRIPPWLRRLTNLRKLDLSKNQLYADSELLETLQVMPKLDMLNLSGNPLFAGEAAAQSLAPVWQRLSELGELYLSGTQGAAKNYGSLAPLKSLKVLDLSGNQIADEVGALELNKLSGFEELNLSKNGIKKFPAEEMSTQRLQFLDLSCNDLTEIPYVDMENLRIWRLQNQKNGPVRLAKDYGNLFILINLITLQCDIDSYIPEGLKEKLKRLAKSNVNKIYQSVK